MKFQWYQVRFLYQIRSNLIEIFDCKTDEPFEGIPIIVCGDSGTSSERSGNLLIRNTCKL